MMVDIHVLILVLLELSLWVEWTARNWEFLKDGVLILVLLELSLWVLSQSRWSGVIILRLNPCFTGT